MEPTSSGDTILFTIEAVMRPLSVALSLAVAGCGASFAPTDAGLDAASDEELEDAPAVVPDASGLATDAIVEATIDAREVTAPWFVDVANAWGLDFVRDDGPDGYESLPDRMGGGVCPIDADGLAPLDLVFAMRPSVGSRTRLYIGRRDADGALHYTDEAASRGLEQAGDVFACLAFDADGDADEDLALLGPGTVQLFDNDGAGVFTDVSSRLGLALDPRDVYAAAAAGDVDRDGDVDLYVAGFMRFDTSRFAPRERCGSIPCRSSLYEFQGIADLLLLREGDGRYRDAAAALAPELLRDEMTFCPAILRVTGEGPVDLFVGNDLGARYRDRVLRWDEGRGVFTDVAIELGLATNARGYGVDTMGFSQGDLDGDGALDFVMSSWPGDTTAAYFCAPLGDGHFCEERGRAIGLALGVGTFRWGLGLGDLDLDGDLDLIEATGHLYAQEDLRSTADELQAPTLYENLGEGMLARRVYPEGDALAVRASTRGLSLVDLDDDGRLDVVMAPSRGAPRVLRNVRESEGHFVRIVLAGPSAGARVSIAWEGGAAVRAHPIGEGFMGNFDPRVHVGVPAGVTAVDLEITWPSGRITRRESVPVDTEIDVSP